MNHAMQSSESTRIVAEPFHGQWYAWFDDQPGVTFSGRTATAAVLRLLHWSGIAPERIATDTQVSRKGRRVYRLKEPRSCPDCRGSGRYVGLLVVENCRRCEGSGRIAG